MCKKEQVMSHHNLKKQLISQPDILLTTPESLAILMTKDEAKKFSKKPIT